MGSFVPYPQRKCCFLSEVSSSVMVRGFSSPKQVDGEGSLPILFLSRCPIEPHPFPFGIGFDFGFERWIPAAKGETPSHVFARWEP